MKPNDTPSGPQTMTLAELCAALENGTLAAQMEDGMYVITHRDLMRLAHPDNIRTISPQELLRNYTQKAS